MIVNYYLLSDSPFSLDVSATLKKEIAIEILSFELTELPWKLRKLQANVLEFLREPLKLFQQQDVQTFYKIVVSRRRAKDI